VGFGAELTHCSVLDVAMHGCDCLGQQMEKPLRKKEVSARDLGSIM